ncbi:MAG: hypothetical protein CBC48_04320 [bacterium TMED88]|nr:hypothetical protein [Deltaproteobacteria bacterium]OUV35216.1 MAG: hypothetical protein CBC48_04320 [bacterium TMED88]
MAAQRSSRPASRRPALAQGEVRHDPGGVRGGLTLVFQRLSERRSNPGSRLLVGRRIGKESLAP